MGAPLIRPQVLLLRWTLSEMMRCAAQYGLVGDNSAQHNQFGVGIVLFEPNMLRMSACLHV